MKSRPISFAGETIRGILDGKTEFRHEGYDRSCPYVVGDILWVRERWCCSTPDITGSPVSFPASGSRKPFRDPVYMPRWASRITIAVADTRKVATKPSGPPWWTEIPPRAWVVGFKVLPPSTSEENDNE